MATLEAKAARVVGVLRELLGDDDLLETYLAVAEAGAALLNSLDDAGFDGDAGVPLGRRKKLPVVHSQIPPQPSTPASPMEA